MNSFFSLSILFLTLLGSSCNSSSGDVTTREKEKSDSIAVVEALKAEQEAQKEEEMSKANAANGAADSNATAADTSK